MIDTATAPYGALLLRLTLGLALIAHGLLKVIVFTIPGTVGYFESIGYPGVLAYPIIVGEVGLGALLVLGLYVRIAALAAVPILIGATIEHLANGWVFTAPGGGWEYPVFWTLALIVQALVGPGAWALRPPGAGRAANAATA